MNPRRGWLDFLTRKPPLRGCPPHAWEKVVDDDSLGARYVCARCGAEFGETP